MSPRADDHRLPEITPDDPRLSEWIDGRLSGAEAAAVGRAVAASPELTRLVADLRGLKATLGGLPATPPDAGFVHDVMAAITAAPAASDERIEDLRDDLRVDAEWHKVEQERIALERAEASADATEAPRTPPRRWRWLPMAGALAAGVLVAAALNVGRIPGGRTIALAPPVDEAESDPDAGVATVDAAPAEESGPAAAAQVQAPAARVQAPAARVQAPANATLAENRKAAPRADAATTAIEPGPLALRPAAEREAEREAARAAPAAVADDDAGRLAAGAGAKATESGVRAESAEGGSALPRPLLVVRVTGPAARERLQALIRDGGATCLPVAPPGANAVLSDPGTVLAETGRITSPGAADAKAELGPAGEFDFLEITGPASTVDALVAALSGRGEFDRARPARAADAEGLARMLIRVVDVEATAAKAAAAATGESP